MVFVIQQAFIYRCFVKQFWEKAVHFPLGGDFLREKVTCGKALMDRILVQLFNGIQREYSLHLWEFL